MFSLLSWKLKMRKWCHRRGSKWNPMEGEHGRHDEKQFILWVLAVFSLWCHVCISYSQRDFGEQKSSLIPLWASHTVRPLLSQQIFAVSNWTVKVFGISPATTPLGSEAFKDPERELGLDPHFQIWYCALVLTESTRGPEPSSVGSCFCFFF